MAWEKPPDDFEAEFDETDLIPDRSQQRKQVSYGWVKTVREAGELYRDTEDIEAVSNEMGLSDKETRDALTVYRVIFEKPPEEVVWKVNTVGRAFFSLNDNVESAIEEDETDPVEHLLREFVGSVHLEYDITEEPVGDPVELTSPPMFTGFDKLAEIMGSKTPHSLASRFANSMQPVIEQRFIMASNISDLRLTRHSDVMKTLASANDPLISHQIQSFQNMVNALEIDFFKGIRIPGPILADIASIQPAINAPTATPAIPTNTFTDVSKSSTVDYPLPNTDPTLLNPYAITTKLDFETLALTVEKIFSTSKERAWLSKFNYYLKLCIICTILVMFHGQLGLNDDYLDIITIYGTLILYTIYGEEE